MRPRYPARHAGRAIHELMNRLVAARLARSPQTDEAGVRRELWQALRDNAGLDPNRLDGPSASAAVWVLTALLELDADVGAPRRGGGGEDQERRLKRPSEE
jgi:hypothetical protein